MCEFCGREAMSSSIPAPSGCSEAPLGAVLTVGSKLTDILINGVALIAEKALTEVCRSPATHVQKIPSERNFINGKI